MTNMFGSQAPSDGVLQFGEILGSSIATDPGSGRNEGLLYSVKGIGGIDYSQPTPQPTVNDDLSERDPAAEAFGQLGFLARPLPPYAAGGENRHAEALCMRSSDGLVPIAYRDTRLRMPGSGPSEGTVAMVGYGGGFLSFDPVVNQGQAEATIQVLYCPFDYNSQGTAQKAHAIILDPKSGNESISIVHADGMAITMFDNSIVMKNHNGTATITLDDSGITMTGQINLAGSVVIGNPSFAVPMLAGVASPPCSTLFLSP